MSLKFMWHRILIQIDYRFNLSYFVSEICDSSSPSLPNGVVVQRNGHGTYAV